MRSQRKWINRILAFIAVGAFAVGCQTPGGGEKKPLSQLKFYIEAVDNEMRSMELSVFQRNPITIRVDRSPVLQEVDLEFADLVQDEFGYTIRLRFNQRGGWILESETAQHLGQRMVVVASFDEVNRAIAAWPIRTRNGASALEFVPDATLEESLRLVEGLRNVVAEVNRFSTSPR